MSRVEWVVWQFITRAFHSDRLGWFSWGDDTARGIGDFKEEGGREAEPALLDLSYARELLWASANLISVVPDPDSSR